MNRPHPEMSTALQAIVDRDIFEKVQSILATNARQRAATTRSATPALLKGLIFTPEGRAMTPHYTKRGSKQYRYYVSTDAKYNVRLTD